MGREVEKPTHVHYLVNVGMVALRSPLGYGFDGQWEWDDVLNRLLGGSRASKISEAFAELVDYELCGNDSCHVITQTPEQLAAEYAGEGYEGPALL